MIKSMIYGGMVLLLASTTSCRTPKVYDPARGSGKYILTPAEKPEPLIHGPSVFGVRPGSPFLYSIPATGTAPLKFAVDGLPAGLTVDENSGLISGVIKDRKEAEYHLTFTVKNQLGEDQKRFKVKVGSTICLTPPLGWNSWNCWQTNVTQEHVLSSARAMVDKGLKNYGWTYINIDDAWQGSRGGQDNAIQPNTEKFPDIKAMCDQIHQMGLKVGIYSTPWITSYAGFVGGSSDSPKGLWTPDMGTREARKSRKFWRVGKFHFDTNDAGQWAQWGIDYLKYDWNPNDAESTLRMANALEGCGRDIVYSLSNTAPLNNAEIFGKHVNCFRTAGDLKDRWDQEGAHLNIRQQWILHRTWMQLGFRGAPGHFPDPDMLVIGDVITGGGDNGQPAPSRLTADEQYSHISLWSLWAAPMLIGAPIETMDDFTLSLLTNEEVLAIHQDEMAIPAQSVRCETGSEIFVKDLQNGDKAVGLFNLDEEDQVITFDWSLANLEGKKVVRDLWRQKEVGTFKDSFSANVPAHGVILLRIHP